MDEMQMRRAIERKRDGAELTGQEWRDIVAAYMIGELDDAQMSAMAMACVWRGLSIAEAAALTEGMVASGDTLRYPDGVMVVDKHSSGGVSDIVSLVAVPIVAACGVHVAKLSGRALGHTGGTIDKLETIPGINLTPTSDAFVRQVERIGCAIAAQTDAFVPADKRLYKLRDRTATIPSVGLIASSIVSKKISAGAAAFVFDTKCGSASFMKTVEEATELASALVSISERFGKRAAAIVSDMNEPLGSSIGTGIELIEAREFLRGSEPDSRLREQSLTVVDAMLRLAGFEDGRARAHEAISSGDAYAKLTQMIDAQGGAVDAFELMRLPEEKYAATAERAGYVWSIDAVYLGNTARALSDWEPTAGIRTFVRIGDFVERGAVLAESYGSRAQAANLLGAFVISDAVPPKRPLIYATI